MDMYISITLAHLQPSLEAEDEVEQSEQLLMSDATLADVPRRRYCKIKLEARPCS